MAKKNLPTMREDFVKIVNETETKLKTSKSKWQKAFLGYAKDLKDRIDDYAKNGEKINKIANLPTDVRIYSSISLVKKSSKTTAYYDMRFRGQHICGIRVINGEVYLHFTESDIKNNKQYFNIKTKFSNNEKLLITEQKAQKFFDELRKVLHGTSKTKETNSPEHKLESLVLENINESDGSIKIPNLHFIQPIKFGSGFFQMPTPFAASKHEPKLSIRKKDGAITGGGIDILARVAKQEPGWRFAVIELKKNEEPVSDVARQALIYATFLAYLIAEEDDDLGKIWYNIFRDQGNNKDVPNTIDILVMTMMPSSQKESKDEEELDEDYKFPIGNKNVRLSLCTCYLDVDEKFTKIKDATGTFEGHKKQPKKK